jgi:hypothetical protein
MSSQVKFYLDIERLEVRKASEETRQHPGFNVGPKSHLNSQHLNVWDSCVWTCLSVNLQRRIVRFNTLQRLELGN